MGSPSSSSSSCSDPYPNPKQSLAQKRIVQSSAITERFNTHSCSRTKWFSNIQRILTNQCPKQGFLSEKQGFSSLICVLNRGKAMARTMTFSSPQSTGSNSEKNGNNVSIAVLSVISALAVSALLVALIYYLYMRHKVKKKSHSHKQGTHLSFPIFTMFSFSDNKRN